MTGPSVSNAAVTPPARRWPRWMGLALMASLAVNLFVAGAIATAVWRHRGAPPTGQWNIYGFARTLSHERRGELLGATRAERQQLRAIRSEIRDARRAVRRALAAKPYDAAAYRQANDTVLAAEQRARIVARSFFDAIVNKLSDAERGGLATWLEHSERPWRHRRGQRGGDTDDDRETSNAPASPTSPSLSGAVPAATVPASK